MDDIPDTALFTRERSKGKYVFSVGGGKLYIGNAAEGGRYIEISDYADMSADEAKQLLKDKLGQIPGLDEGIDGYYKEFVDIGLIEDEFSEQLPPDEFHAIDEFSRAVGAKVRVAPQLAKDANGEYIKSNGTSIP